MRNLVVVVLDSYQNCFQYSIFQQRPHRFFSAPFVTLSLAGDINALEMNPFAQKSLLVDFQLKHF